MKTIKVALPVKLEMEARKYVKSGWFADEAELLRAALEEYMRHHRFQLMERFTKEDINWALKVKAGAR